ncbi:Pnap_2097 family protein [Methylobacillus flagellatus]|uniref:Pnap_2097 family protein n=1 Tax=Methylobacillus flagellatus TaxID=405 RepID=UPI0010F90D4C|nr:Pnap_2097 family protein [Methylobacillus flagellatus]
MRANDAPWLADVQPSSACYLAGMPQLGYQGLSENWLLKECGHLHWTGLADKLGKATPEFIDDEGRKAYAAFIAVRVRAYSPAIRENQSFVVRSALMQVAQARHFSAHALQPNEEAGTLAEAARWQVEMLSTLVFRREADNNQSVMRASFSAAPNIQSTPEAEELMETSMRMRKGVWSECMGFSRVERRNLKQMSFLPCPDIDFNGANFLYFANFQAFVERAEWQWFGRMTHLVEREMYFYSNLNVGDRLVVQLCDLHMAADGMRTWCEVQSEGGRKLADVFTHKRYSI